MDLRKQYLCTYYCKHPSVIKMNHLFNTHSKVVLINICQYLKQYFKRMTSIVNLHVYIYISMSAYNCSPINFNNFLFAFIEL